MDNLKNIDLDDFILEDDIESPSPFIEPDIKSNQEGESLAQQESELIIPRCEFLTGGAGTGKTYEIRRRIEEYASLHPTIDRSYGILAATTGIAAINLGDNTTTINSVLRFFDTESLEEAYTSGKLQQSLKEISRLADNLIIDEISMMHAKQLDIIWDALVEINQHMETREREGLGLIITGDFCQLPPVPDKNLITGKSIDAKYAFEAQCWKYFEGNTTKLTKNWRQDDLEFVKALNYARRGDGVNCVAVLRAHKGVKFNTEIETDFDGTTIFSKNVEVDRLNQTRLRNLLHGGRKLFTVKSFRWGKQRGEWKNIPEQLEVCTDCYVMILANDSKQNGFRYANGTTGYVVKYQPPIDKEELDKQIEDIHDLAIETQMTNAAEGFEDRQERIEVLQERFNPTPNTFLVKLKSNNMEVEVGKICRKVLEKKHPDGVTERPSFDSLKEWKENNPDRFNTAKQAKFIYENEYLVKITNEGMKSSHSSETYINNEVTVYKCKCGHRFDKRNEWEEHKRKSSPEVYFDYSENKWVTGEIYYYPLRLAYASTCHKSQGLTLDRVQIDFINQFFGSPSMAYVALSRVKTAEGLRLVGSPKLLEERINVNRKVMRFI